MSYNGTGALARGLGYSSWADFVGTSNPQASGAVEILQEANYVVNFAYWNKPGNATNADHTGLLGTYEKKVFKRIWLNNQGAENGKGTFPYDDYLIPAERSLLGKLGGARPVMVKFNRSAPDV